jgi:amino acid adenylation domain-containing protein
MWFLDHLAPGSGAFTIACALRITASVDIAQLKRAFEMLIERHPILRTTYRIIDAVPDQEVGGLPADWFSHLDAAEWTPARLADELTTAAMQPFDLAHGPVMRITLFSRAEAEHVLLLAVHHVAADFWSVEVLLTEFGELYRSGRMAGSAAVPRAEYLDYVSWQSKLLSGQEGDRLWAYWRKALGGELPVLQLPADRQRPTVQTYPGAVERFTLDAELTRQLKALAAEHGATVYMTLLATFFVLLYRYTGQNDIIVGSPFAARGRAAFADTVGYLVNTIPLRVAVFGDMSFAELLGRVQTAVMQGLAHQDFPFAEIVARLGAARDPARSPVFQVAFTFQQAHLPGHDSLAGAAFGVPGLTGQLGDLPVESVALSRPASQFDLSLQLAECANGITGSFIYNTDLFDAETISGLAVHLRSLLETAVAVPGRRVSALPMAEVTDDGHAAEASAPTHPVHRLIAAQAARRPTAPAVFAGPVSLTYGELNSAANRLSHYLRRRGVRRGSVVGILLDRGALQVVSVLAILKAGAAYAPIDPGYPAERVAFMVSDAKIDLLLTQESLRGLASSEQMSCISMDTLDLANLSDLPNNDLPDLAGPMDLACVLYTSGSAGRPKGVMITHAGLSTQVKALTERLNVTELDRHLLVQSLAFAASIRQITVPLCNGGAVVIATASQAADIPALLDLVRDAEVTMMSANPTFWRHWVGALDKLPPDTRRKLRGSGLRVLLAASEPLTPDVPSWLHAELGPSPRFVNMLGQTEVSGIATTYQVPTDAIPATPTLPIGTALPGIGVYILNEAMEPVPDGVAGELYLAGPAVARGYMGRPALTAERLLPNPHADPPGQRMLRTGDLVLRGRDGVLRHLGRVDGQLKIRGFRVEPAEVEGALLRHPGVRASAVTAHADKSGVSRLVAYIVPAGPVPATASELRRHVQALLPTYLVPSVFETIDALPLNANGKVAKGDLPVPLELRPVLDDAYSPPGSGLEQTVAAIWAETLGVDRVGVNDNFFDLGGTSLSVMSVQALLRERLGFEVAVALLFQFPTVQSLTGHLSEAEHATAPQVERGRATGSRRRQMLDDFRTRPSRPTR